MLGQQVPQDEIETRLKDWSSYIERDKSERETRISDSYKVSRNIYSTFARKINRAFEERCMNLSSRINQITFKNQGYTFVVDSEELKSFDERLKTFPKSILEKCKDCEDLGVGYIQNNRRPHLNIKVDGATALMHDIVKSNEQTLKSWDCGSDEYTKLSEREKDELRECEDDFNSARIWFMQNAIKAYKCLID